MTLEEKAQEIEKLIAKVNALAEENKRLQAMCDYLIKTDAKRKREEHRTACSHYMSDGCCSKTIQTYGPPTYQSFYSKCNGKCPRMRRYDKRVQKDMESALSTNNKL